MLRRVLPRKSVVFIDHSLRMSNRTHKPMWWGNVTPRPQDWNPSNEEGQGVPYPFSCNTETVFWFLHFLCAADGGSRFFFYLVFETQLFICQKSERYFLEDGNLHPSYTVRHTSFPQRCSWAFFWSLLEVEDVWMSGFRFEETFSKFREQLIQPHNVTPCIPESS